MAQRSKIFVVYRAIKSEEDEVEYEYMAHMGKSLPASPASKGSPVSRDLADAIQFDRDGAFKHALHFGGPWSVAELVSDRSGVHIEE